MTQSIGIAGAGIIGRLIALKAAAQGKKVTLFDRDETPACSVVAPAMLAPYCELDVAEKAVSDLGVESLKLWPEILKSLDAPVFFQQEGSLVVAHPADADQMTRFKRNVVTRASADVFREVGGSQLKELEPQLDPCFETGLFFPHEAQIDSRALIASLLQALRKRNVSCRFGEEITQVAPHEIRLGAERLRFDVVFDCRGYGAAADIPDLRAVRGELIHVEAKEVHIRRPVRLLHPRWPLYVVPRPEGRFVIGASTIESEDGSPISIRSTLEMLSAAYALHAGFSEARILENVVGLRPAYPDNQPRIEYQPGLVRVNGMYRHGYLCSPKVTDLALAFAESDVPESGYGTLFQQAA